MFKAKYASSYFWSVHLYLKGLLLEVSKLERVFYWLTWVLWQHLTVYLYLILILNLFFSIYMNGELPSYFFNWIIYVFFFFYLQH